jgi:hypothetical protein
VLAPGADDQPMALTMGADANGELLSHDSFVTIFSAARYASPLRKVPVKRDPVQSSA